MNEIEKLNMIAEWQEQHKQLIQDLDNSKKRIAELEEENAEAKERIKTLEYRCENIKDTDTMELVALQKENAELKCECRRCVYTDSPCVLSDYGKDGNGICDHFKDVFEELNNWKDEWQEQVQKATDEGYARTLQTIQLNKAKDHIKKLLDCLKQDTNDPQTNYYVCQYMDKAEQFLNKE